MRLLLPRVLLLTGPVALAFFSGGFTDGAREAALAVAAATLVVILALAPRSLVPRQGAVVTAVAGLIGLAAWVTASGAWSPVSEVAGDDAERVTLYALVLVCALAAGRERVAARWTEVGVAAGATVVIGYGLAGRLRPSLVPQQASASAGGRLEQPLTYWNAEGALAAIGFVLCARIAGDRDRPPALRMAAAAAACPLAAGVYLSFSRGAAVALLAGIVVLLVLSPTWTQLRGLGIAAEAGAAGTIAVALSPAVRTLAGDHGARDGQGAIVLASLLTVMGAAAVLTRWATRAEAAERARAGRLPLPAWGGTAALGVVVALVAVPVIVARGDDGPRRDASTARFASVASDRYDYWQVALGMFADEPLVGAGSGAFAVEWQRERPGAPRVRDAHSLPLETLAELGLIGALLLASLLVGVGLAARAVQRADPSLAAGPACALMVYAVHSAIDWDWELPALTLPVLVLAGMLLAQAEAGGRTPPAAGIWPTAPADPQNRPS